jgi:hypothetical protein
MSDSDFQDIERALGHDVNPGRKGSIHDLYDVPSDLLEDARNLRSLTLRYRFLRYHTSSSLWRWLSEFIDDVLDRGIELQAWRRGGILYPLLPIETLVTLDVARILSVLEPTEDESWRQVAPGREAWEIGESVAGAPVVERSQLRYDWEPSKQVRRVMMNGLEDLLDVDDIVVATRRWIASRVARQASKFGGIERFSDPIAVFESAFQGVQCASDDALIATRGVLHESRAMGRSAVDVPGFRGPADWYR